MQSCTTMLFTVVVELSKWLQKTFRASLSFSLNPEISSDASRLWWLRSSMQHYWKQRWVRLWWKPPFSLCLCNRSGRLGSTGNLREHRRFLVDSHANAVYGWRSVDADSDHGQCHLLGDEGKVAMLQRKEELRFGQNVRFRGSNGEDSHEMKGRDPDCD